MKEHLIVIPYLASGAQGNELELAVQGWRKHFKEPYKLCIIGDWHPVATVGKDTLFIPCPRVAPVEGQYLPHLDHKAKMLKVYEKLGKHYDGFIFTSDDVYAVRNFTMEDILAPKMAAAEVPMRPWRNETGWLRDWYKTRVMCYQLNLTAADWVTHLPLYYDFRKLLATFSTVEANESYVWENLYFNFEMTLGALPLEPDMPLCTPQCKWKYAVMTSSPGFNDVEETGAIWINNGNCGWSKELEDKLSRHYWPKGIYA